MSTTQTRLRLPDFLIIGVQKGGTTAMMENLNYHPDVHVHQREVGFFGENKHSLAEYCSLFPQDVPVVGEKTPRYIFLPRAREAIRRLHPSAKLIVSLRDPVRRFHSAINHYVQISAPGHWDLWEGRTPEELVAKGVESSMIARGCYANQLEALLELGFRPEQIHDFSR